MSYYKLSASDIITQQRIRNKKKIRIYRQILIKCHQRIKFASEKNCKWCIYIVPNFIVGSPLYDVNACIIYIIKQLEDGGFIIKYTHPNLIYISWDKKNNHHYSQLSYQSNVQDSSISYQQNKTHQQLSTNIYNQPSVHHQPIVKQLNNNNNNQQIQHVNCKPQLTYSPVTEYKPKKKYNTPYNNKKIESIDKKMDFLFKDLD